jgi:hypothetical protein
MAKSINYNLIDCCWKFKWIEGWLRKSFNLQKRPEATELASGKQSKLEKF